MRNFSPTLLTRITAASFAGLLWFSIASIVSVGLFLIEQGGGVIAIENSIVAILFTITVAVFVGAYVMSRRISSESQDQLVRSVSLAFIPSFLGVYVLVAVGGVIVTPPDFFWMTVLYGFSHLIALTFGLSIAWWTWHGQNSE